MEAVQITIVLFLSWFAAVQCDVYAEIGLNEHNRLRKLHGVDPLTLNSQLSQQANDYAADIATKQSLEHSKSDGLYGENLCLRSEDPERCVQMWYDEIRDYDYSNPRFTYTTGHFTQVVWAGTTEMGWGQARDKTGVYYVVARYTPPGNIRGEFDKNVPEPLEGLNSAPGQIGVSLNAMIISLSFGLLKFTYCQY